MCFSHTDINFVENNNDAGVESFCWNTFLRYKFFYQITLWEFAIAIMIKKNITNGLNILRTLS